MNKLPNNVNFIQMDKFSNNIIFIPDNCDGNLGSLSGVDNQIDNNTQGLVSALNSLTV